MKIEVIIPSRGRQQTLQAGIVSMHALQSDVHDVRYVVLCDDDDHETREAAERIQGIPLRVVQGPRRLINAWENEVIAASDADAFMPWPDDYVCLSYAWDEIIATVLKSFPAFSWQEVQDPKNHTTIVLSREWVQATGRFFTEHFPFWFADTWLKEVFGFVYAHDMPIIQQLQISHKRKPTHNMHDLEFWFRVFATTRHERIAEAKRICQAMGRTMPDSTQIVELFERGDALQLERIPQYETFYGADTTEKSAAYIAAKTKAERVLSVEAVFEEAA